MVLRVIQKEASTVPALTCQFDKAQREVVSNSLPELGNFSSRETTAISSENAIIEDCDDCERNVSQNLNDSPENISSENELDGSEEKKTLSSRSLVREHEAQSR
ncbi:hypothetical protein OUZ56_011655 [Daphnia magna]|uniref:Uncharacterized protein n=1 Tax=Daphnia magna TaxID=35525 RepID=A0ABQ9Z0R3_9CRUS|nr:hypothetical protein OUZ56_011655 [Daphnia magna]